MQTSQSFWWKLLWNKLNAKWMYQWIGDLKVICSLLIFALTSKGNSFNITLAGSFSINILTCQPKFVNEFVVIHKFNKSHLNCWKPRRKVKTLCRATQQFPRFSLQMAASRNPNALYLNSLNPISQKSMCSPSWLKHKDGCSDRCFWIFRENKWMWMARTKAKGVFRWTKIVWQGNLFWYRKRKTEKRVVLLEADDKRCVYCECFKRKKHEAEEGTLGWSTKWFSQTKTKRISFVRILDEKYFLG